MKKKTTYIQEVIALARRKKVALIVSVVNVLVLTILTYILNNQPLFTGENLTHFTCLEYFKNILGTANTFEDDVLFVNVSYDKQLIDQYDEFGMSIGNTDITDRSKLLTFLKALSVTNKYEYVFLDVRFEKGYNASDIDDELFETIKGMKHIVMANHRDIELADSTLSYKAAISDYTNSVFSSSFIRYRFLYDVEPSMALFAYQDKTGKLMKKHGLFYSCDKRLCYNSLFINFPIEPVTEFDVQGRKGYYNLGSDILDNYTDDDIATLTEGKYIVIGNLIENEDMHDTYAGPKPGAVITYYAFKDLINGKHIVSFLQLGIWAIIFFLVSVSQFSHYSLLESIPYVKESHSKLLHFFLSFIEYTFLLTLVVIVINIIYDISTSIILPSAYFAVQKNIINFKRMKLS